MKLAHIAPHYTRYGKNGYDCFAVGLPTFFARTIKIAKEWCDSHGLDYVRL
jgi:hypothetical protein